MFFCQYILLINIYIIEIFGLKIKKAIGGLPNANRLYMGLADNLAAADLQTVAVENENLRFGIEVADNLLNPNHNVKHTTL